ncbi:hypothetical protein [Tenacibaculum sp. nBUS_03]
MGIYKTQIILKVVPMNKNVRYGVDIEMLCGEIYDGKEILLDC